MGSDELHTRLVNIEKKQYGFNRWQIGVLVTSIVGTTLTLANWAFTKESTVKDDFTRLRIENKDTRNDFNLKLIVISNTVHANHVQDSVNNLILDRELKELEIKIQHIKPRIYLHGVTEHRDENGDITFEDEKRK